MEKTITEHPYDGAEALRADELTRPSPLIPRSCYGPPVINRIMSSSD